METPLEAEKGQIRDLVLTVPMRNGNPPHRVIPYTTPHLFLPYLWGMETFKSWRFDGKIWVLTVPMRNGNPGWRVYNSRWHAQVLTVPMRNGNLQHRIRYQQCVRVLTVPMRNGNTFRLWRLLLPFSFLPYLWGMETNGIKNELASMFTVLTVPMRNGNIVNKRVYLP